MVLAHLFPPVRNVGVHGGQKIQGIEGPFLGSVFRSGNNLGGFGEILHPFVGEGSPDDVPGHLQVNFRLGPDDFSERPRADLHAWWCGEGRLKAVPYPIGQSVLSALTFFAPVICRPLREREDFVTLVNYVPVPQ